MTIHSALRWRRIIVTVLLGCAAFLFIPQPAVHGEEAYTQEKTEQDNSVYDSLKERIRDSWDSGMDQLEEVNPIEITGNFAERILRTIAAACYSNLKSIKAGALLIGLVSFVLGSVVALLAKKDKKMRKTAISAGMVAVPTILLIIVFGISWFISIFQ